MLKGSPRVSFNVYLVPWGVGEQPVSPYLVLPQRLASYYLMDHVHLHLGFCIDLEMLARSRLCQSFGLEKLWKVCS